jgi:Ni,Fe-hydrogenase I small subunit
MNVLRHGMSRRKFLKSAATASAALALSPLAVPAVRAASALKLGYVSP